MIPLERWGRSLCGSIQERYLDWETPKNSNIMPVYQDSDPIPTWRDDNGPCPVGGRERSCTYQEAGLRPFGPQWTTEGVSYVLSLEGWEIKELTEFHIVGLKSNYILRMFRAFDSSGIPVVTIIED